MLIKMYYINISFEVLMSEKIIITYDEFHALTINLAEKIKNIDFSYIVAPSRGGLLPGIILSHELQKEVIPIQWSTRDGTKKEHKENIVQDLKIGKTILLVDDINDSGKSFIGLLDDWEAHKNKGKVIKTSILQRYSTKLSSDYYSRFIDNDNWVYFPWEKQP